MTKLPNPLALQDDRSRLISHMLRELESPAKELSPKELDFVIDMQEQWTARRWMSDDQLKWLEAIYAEKTA